jgi:hypothetical protein
MAGRHTVRGTSLPRRIRYVANLLNSSRSSNGLPAAIQSTKVTLLIVTADFIASDFIADNELPRLLEVAKNDGALIMSLIVSRHDSGRRAFLSFRRLMIPSGH